MAEREDRGPGIAARVFPDARRSVYIPSGGSGRGLTGGTAVKSRSRPGRSAKDEFAIANCHRRGASTPANADRIFDAQPPVHPSHRCWRSRTGKGIAGLPDRALTDQQHDLLLNGLAQRRPALLSSNCKTTVDTLARHSAKATANLSVVYGLQPLCFVAILTLANERVK